MNLTMVMKEIMVIIPMEASQVASHNLELSIGKMLNFSLDCILLKIETSSAAGGCAPRPLCLASTIS